ncbi:MAG: metal-dependent DNase [Candidatus Wolfebacteria bacterium GW2011_GWA2_42_10]|uniref:Metal-dependent DNase n=2 Tax=Candidatus Wolfeibacteriota TaxID=1752735 RepID=A0A0G0XLC6_9BACT|nr:MAG: metal-dependent DNase [Candidatus Wolfebacteria bacterium GW2011_GWB1_41_12]KKS25252.1 MAG: metal-dependent DNase [Candidatus Wolfebacteria bacterium GW2011_GWA2_42_10]KKT56692.1 MAG: metal-dependent DNase [Candidatus Wolfebacteria bacterium GW2011_GWA1_44_24]
MLFDAHTHVNFNAFKNDWREVIDKALKNNIWLVNVGSQSTTSKRAVEIAQNYEKGVYAAVGLHPAHLFETEVDRLEAGEKIQYKTRGEDFDKNYYLELAKNEKVVAIGECGLDYYRIKDEKSKIKQKEVFIKHIKLANEIDKPLMIHCRQAFDDSIEILKSEVQNLKPGVIHFFTGTLDDAKKLLAMGFYFTFGGLITFNRDFDEIIRYIPLEKILLETDAPYVAPASYRGQRNEPAHIIETAKKLAEIKGLSLEKISEQTVKNSLLAFGL